MRPRVLTLPALFLSLLLVGCGGDDGAAGPPGSPAPVDAETASAVDPADGGEASSPGGRQGRVTTDEGVYAFEASTCLVDDASPIGGVSIVEGDERRLGVTFQVDASADEVLDFYRAELPGAGWTVEEPEQVGVPMLKVAGHGYDGAVTVQVAGGVTSLSFSFMSAA